MTTSAGPRRLASARKWLTDHDPGYSALRRAARAAILLPALVALVDKAIANVTMSYFSAFGCFAMLLLVDFQGSLLDRLRAQGTLALACVGLICLGTLASRSTVLAVVGMGLAGFAVLFSGVVSSVLASATTTLLLAFILPVSLPGGAAQIPDRIAGWGLAAGVSMAAIVLLWPAPARNPLRTAAIAACRALAARLRAEVAFRTGDGSPASEAAHEQAIAAADGAVDRLHSVFFATPFRPTGLTTDARAVVRLVDELRWLNRAVLRAARPPQGMPVNLPACAVKSTAAEVLEVTAGLLDAPGDSSEQLHAAVERMHGALGELEARISSSIPAEVAGAASSASSARRAVSALDPSFRAQELSFVVSQVATNADFAAAAARRSWLGRLVGRRPTGLRGPLASFQERAGSHARWSSSWLHNSLRGATGLALAVLVADLTSVQHGFWVVFGTLAVLRSNALSTGQNVLRAMAGTTVGFVVGGVVVYLIGTSTALLWALLPFVILFAGLAPAAISFAAGQAAFTTTLLILFNVLAPAGWTIGLVRIEDVALGSAVSLAVGVLFWPRGAAAALGRALSDAYAAGAGYLAAAVAYGAGRCDPSGPPLQQPSAEAAAAAAGARRLDDTFRGYLAERGSKPIPLAAVTGLVTGVAALRLSADAVLDLWQSDDTRSGDRSAARRELRAAAGALGGWYGHFAASLTGSEAVPEPLSGDRVADGRLIEAVATDLRDADGHETATGIRVIWTADHLDAVRRLQEALVEPAREAASERALAPGDLRLGLRALAARA
jgi:uncharacterized membrane protein YccC